MKVRTLLLAGVALAATTAAPATHATATKAQAAPSTAAASADVPVAQAAPQGQAHADGPAAATATVNTLATWSAAGWDGAHYTNDQPDTSTLPGIHVVYLYPSDGPDRFLTYAPMFQAEDRRASTLLEKATGMQFRYDTRLGTNGATYDDITVLHATRYNTTQLSSASQFSYVQTELKNAGLNLSTKKYMVWLDASSQYYGQSTAPISTTRASSNAANGRTVSVMYRYFPTDTVNANGQMTGGFVNPVIHELTHAMGAVQSAAPHWISGSHCNDDAQDYMCSTNATPNTYDPTLPRTYDSGDNDYLDPAADVALTSTAKLAWWTVNLSKYFCPRASSVATTADCSQANNPSY